MDNEKLIYEVSKHQELFDTKHRCYFDTENRQKLWYEISKIMETSPEQCKNRWRNLRTSFVNELRKSAKNTTGKKYMYYQQMIFLLPYVLHRRGNLDGNFTTNEITEIENNTTYESEYDSSMDRLQICIEQSPHPSPEDRKEFIDLKLSNYKDYSIVDQETTNTPNFPNTDRSLVNKQGHKRRRHSVIEYQREEKLDDPLKHFFMTMYETVKNFPPHLQITAKRAIFTEVTNLEEKMHETQYFTQNTNVDNCTN